MSMSGPRRRFLLGAAATPLLLAAPGLALAAAPGDKRFVFIVLRGAMDGLHAVVPFGDPDYAAARGGLAMPREGVIALDGFYGFHLALDPLVPHYRLGDVLVVHAVASPYRDRSHFDGQDVLENGGTAPHLPADGWVNRALKAMSADRNAGLAVSQGIPLALRGSVPVTSWTPAPLPGMSPQMVERLKALYAGDAELTMALEEGVQGADFVAATLGGQDMGSAAPGTRKYGQFAKVGQAVGKLLAAPNGPRVAVMEVLGWDTHIGQGLERGRMADVLTQLGEGIGAMREALGPAWRNTVIVTGSEFGRTVAMNGTNGSDHGTATAVLISGGAVAGGRVIARWPGMAHDKLYQGRDLMPTTDLRAVLKGLLRDHMGVSETALAQSVFPGSAEVAPMAGLVKA
jgi:uncharacterized protein (DUF1501 family)